ncbi:MAG: tetratricopeptide repeat protein [Vicinamibacterales bacterium]|nr:tetratricopeptide repeat protein [Vicinamibacterales bacterium]
MPRPNRTTKRSAPSGAPSAIWWRIALILLAGALAYSNSLSGPFVFDDETAIVGNPAIRSLSTALAPQMNSPVAGRPAVALSFAANFALGELNVRVYHATNIAIHLACALLLFGIVRRTLMLPRLEQQFGPAAANLALATGLLWVVHPLNTEPVSYLTQRTESMMALCYLTTLYASLRAHFSPRPATWRALAILSCAAGMACKETMATVPFMVVLFDRIFVFGSFAQALSARWRFYGGLALSWIVLLYLILPGPRHGSAGFSTPVDSWTYLLNQARMIVRYLRLVLWPRDLVMHYGAPFAVTLAAVLPYAVAVAGLLLLTVMCLRWQPAVGFLGVWVFVTLAPASSVIPIATEVGAERRMYLPLMGILALIVCGLYGIESIRQRTSSRHAMLIVATLTIVLGAGTIARNQEYASGLSLAQASLSRWPSDLAHGAVGSELARLHRDTEALPELRIGARTDPRTRYNLGITLFNLKQLDESIAALQVLVDEHPSREEIPWARRTIGYALSLQGRWPQAINELRVALSMAPNDSQAKTLLAAAYVNEGLALADAGRFTDAVQSFREALKIEPDSIRLRHNLAAALIDSGDLAGGLAEARQTVARDPADASSYDLIGRALAMQGNLDEAITQFEQAARLAPNDAAIQDDLQRALAARGRQ